MKKWTYLVAALLATSAGSLMTGCIDNDEPYGIEQIRVATANLLDAKKALLDAQAAASNSAVEIAKIQAEIDKAKIEIDKITAEAEAKIKEAEAQAILLRAQADAAKTQAEAEQLLAQAAIAQAEADRIKAEAESAAKRTQAEIDALIAETEAKMKFAELSYEQALYFFEKMKADNAACADSKLYKAVELAFEDYLEALRQYNEANKVYLNAQKTLAESEVDLVWVEGEDGEPGHFESTKYDQKDILDKAVANAQAQIANSEAAIEFYTEAAAAFEGVKSGELYTLLEGYEQQLAANEEALAKLEIEREEIYLKNKPLFEDVDNIEKEIAATQTKDIEIAPYTYEPDASNSIPGFEEKIVVVEEGATYKWMNAMVEGSPYLKAKAEYTRLINGMNDAVMDENDQAWTQARINEMTRQLAAKQETYEYYKARWEFAKQLFNNGDLPNLSVLPLNDELTAAIAAYNGTEESIAAAREAYYEAVDAQEEAYKALDEAYTSYNDETGAWAVYSKAKETYKEAVAEANKVYHDAAQANWITYQKAIDKNEADFAKAEAAFRKAQTELDIAYRQAEIDPEFKGVEAARTAFEAAQKALAAASTAKDNADEAARAARDLNNDKAYIANEKAELAAQETLDKAYQKYLTDGGNWNYESGVNQDVDPAYAAVKAANEVYFKAMDAVSEAKENFKTVAETVQEKWDDVITARNEQISELSTEWGYYDQYDGNYYFLKNEVSAYLNENNLANKELEFPVATIEKVSSVYQEYDGEFQNIKAYLTTQSQSAFGWDSYLTMKDQPYKDLLTTTRWDWWVDDEGNYHDYEVTVDLETAFLIDVTKETVDSYIKLRYPEMPTYEYYKYYSDFGAFGATLYLENRIAMANAYLNNSDVIASTVSTLTANLEALEADYKAVTDDLLALDEQKKEAVKKIDDLFKDIKTREDAITHENKHLGLVISEINSAILKIELGFDAMDGATADGVIETLILFCNMMIESETAWIETQKELLARAEYQLKQYEEGYTKLDNPNKLAVEEAKAALDLAQARLDFYKARLDEAQERYDAAQKNNK